MVKSDQVETQTMLLQTQEIDTQTASLETDEGQT